MTHTKMTKHQVVAWQDHSDPEICGWVIDGKSYTRNDVIEATTKGWRGITDLLMMRLCVGSTYLESQLSHSSIIRVKSLEEVMTFEESLTTHEYQQEDIGNLNEIPNTDIFVLSLPKCGTTSIADGFRNLGIKAIHAHINESTWHYVTNGQILRENGWGMEHFIQHRLRTNPKEITIFSGFRDPITWYLSLMTHYTEIMTPELQQNFLINLYHAEPWSAFSFVKQFKLIEACTGVNILEREFDQKNGLSVIKGEGFKLVLFRLDKIGNLETYIRESTPDFSLANKRINTSDNYLRSKSQFKISHSDADMLRIDPYVKLFFGSEFDVSNFVEEK